MLALKGRHLGTPQSALPHLERAYQETFDALLDRIIRLQLGAVSQHNRVQRGNDFLTVSTTDDPLWPVKLELEARSGGWYAQLQRGKSYGRTAMQIAVWTTAQQPTLVNLEEDALEERLGLYASLVKDTDGWSNLTFLKWDFTIPLLFVLDFLLGGDDR